MRHGASLLASLEGLGRTTFRIAQELANNSRAGLTVRFLSKKLDVPMEEVDYLIDVNHRLFFTDLTKVKLVPEGFTAVRRINEGLTNLGDVPSLHARVKSLSPHDFRRLEERLGSEQPLAKKAAVEMLLEKYYRHPDAVLNYVATRGFSATALEVFDILWHSKSGVMPVSQIHAIHGGTEYDVEQALWELFQGFAAFELFRFDAEDRLMRVAGLLSEIRQYRQAGGLQGGAARLNPVKGPIESPESRHLSLSDTICRIVGTLAARPARLRNDGELFREDQRRLEEICGEEDEPSLNTCLWITSALGWLAQVDSLLVVTELEPIIALGRVARHRLVFECVNRLTNNAAVCRTLAMLLEDLREDAWYNTLELVGHAIARDAEKGRPVLRSMGGHYEYVNPAVSGREESNLARALEEFLFWLGVVERGEGDRGSVTRITPLGRVLLKQLPDGVLRDTYPEPSGEIVVQPNFDIVVPHQDMDPLLTVPLDQFAERMSSGQVCVYRVTKDSYLQALQNGHDPAAFADFLMRHNRGGSLPANVRATLDDWRGGVKRIRLRTCHVIETDDPMVMLDLSHRKRLVKYLEPVDPHKSVRYRGASRAELVKILEKEGFVIE